MSESGDKEAQRTARASTILTKFKQEQEQRRAVATINNADSALVKSGDPQVLDLFGLSGSTVSVTPATAQRNSAVAASIVLRCNALSTLPLHHYQKNDKGHRKRVKDSPFWRLFNLSPHENWTSSDMYSWWERCCILRGDAFTEILRDRYGNVTGLYPWHPDRSQVAEVDGRLLYKHHPKDGEPYVLAADDVLHMTGNGFDGVKSLSAIQHDAKNSIGIALAASEHAQKFFEKGASPKHLFGTDKEMDVDQIDEFRKLYDTRYAGNHNVGRPMILTEGLTMQSLSMSAVDAQLLEVMKYSVIDVARAIGAPAVLINANESTSSWGSGIFEIKQGFVTFHLEPRANKWEQEINRKILRKSDEKLEFNFKTYLRGDSKAEADAMRQAIGGSQGPGWMKIDEVRAIDNLPPLEDGEGDKIYIPKGSENEQKATTTD